MMQRKNKSSKSGCLFLVLGTLGVILGMVLFIFLTGQLTGLLMQSVNGGKAAYALLHFNEAAIIICFVLLEAVLFIKFIPNEEDYKKKRGIGYVTPEENKRKIPTKTILRFVLIGIAAVILFLPFLSASTYTLVSEDGIKSHFFVDTKEHSWDDVVAYKVDCDSSKGLSMSFTMDDGSTYEVLHGPKSTTIEFDEQYGDTLEFLVEIDAGLKARGLVPNTPHMETAVEFYKNTELWEYVAVLTGYADIYPEEFKTTETQ